MANMSSRSESQEQRSSPGQTGLASKLSQGASEVTDQAREGVQRTRVRLEDELAQRRTRISKSIRSVGEVLDTAGSKLGDDDVVADGLHYVSGKIERVASYIESADPHRVAHDLGDVARERPAWVFGGVFVLGLALGRFAKSSAETLADDEGREDTGTWAPARATGSGQSAGKPQTSAGGSAVATQAGASSGAAGSPHEASSGVARPPPPRPNQGVRQP